MRPRRRQTPGRLTAPRCAALLCVAAALCFVGAQPAGDGRGAVTHTGVKGAPHAYAADGARQADRSSSPILDISATDDVLAEVEAEALLADADGGADDDDDAADADDELLASLEERLFQGPPGERDVAAAVVGLRALAEAVPLTGAAVPLASRRQPRVSVGGDALFLLAAFASTGVLPPDAMPWDDAWAERALARAAATGSLEATLALGDRAAHASPDDAACEAGMPLLRTAADEVLRRAEAAADHSVPREPARLRERHRDGAWASREAADADAPDQLLLEEDMAARGLPEAQRHVGYRRLLGRGVAADAAAAAVAFAEAAAAGDEYAMFNLGFMKMRGLDGPRNFTAARTLFAAAAERELPAAFNGLGVLAFNGWGAPRNFTEARLAFEEGAARGDPDAHYNLGCLYAGGHGVAVDAEAALASFEAASEAGHWRAPHSLAGMHAAGTGTPRNCSRAARLLLLFAEERLGWAAAVDAALEAYDAGDALGALAQLAPLAAQGCEAAASNAAFILLRRRGVAWLSRDEATQRAVALLRFAAVRGADEAHVDLGDVALAAGDLAAAQAHFADAAAASVAEGHFSLGVLHLRGLADGGAPRNLSAAADCFAAAWELAPTDEAVLPPALALAALRTLQVAEQAAAALRQVRWETIDGWAIAALTLALAAVLHRLGDRRARAEA